MASERHFHPPPPPPPEQQQMTIALKPGHAGAPDKRQQAPPQLLPHQHRHGERGRESGTAWRYMSRLEAKMSPSARKKNKPTIHACEGGEGGGGEAKPPDALRGSGAAFCPIRSATTREKRVQTPGKKRRKAQPPDDGRDAIEPVLTCRRARAARTGMS